MRALTIAASLTGFAAVALGAFGAHGLEGRLSDQALEWWKTATFYALPHAVAAMAIGLSRRAGLAIAGWAFLIGAALFAGSLYAMALGGPRMLGAVTPLGGVSFLAGWALMTLGAVRSKG